MTQRQIVRKVLEDANDWLPTYELMQRATKYGWIGSEGGRRLRELFALGLVEKKREGKYEYYKLKLKEPYQTRLI